MTTEDHTRSVSSPPLVGAPEKETSGSGPTTPKDPVKARKALLGAWMGFYVDLFDIYLPIVVLAPAMTYFVHPDMGTTNIAIVGGAMFAATLIGRPIGAAVFGWVADTVGRKKTTIIAMNGAGVVTFLIALLPGYAQIGLFSVAAFVVLRLVAGFFLGGEYTGANPLAMEAAPPHKRGLYSGIINTGFPLAYASVSLITLLLLLVMPSGGPDSAYAQWGWRIPFVIGAVLSFGAAYYFSKSVSESEVFTRSKNAGSPLRELFQPDNAKRFVQVFVLMSGFWLALQPVAALLPLLLGERGVGMTPRTVVVTLVAAYLILAGVDVAAAVFSQRIGRRRFLIGASVLMLFAATALFLSIVKSDADDLLWVVIATILLVVIVICPWAVLPAYINERFPTSVRASGYGLAYSLAVVLPSFYAFYQAGLENFMAFEDTGAVLLVVGALLVLGAAILGPETKGVDMEAQ